MVAEGVSSRGQIRIILIVLIGIALVIFVVQNAQSVQTKFLMFEATMPHAAGLLITAAVGFLAGLLAAGLRRTKG